MTNFLYFCGEKSEYSLNMPKKRILLCLAALLPILCAFADVSPETLAKRAKRKNLTVKEWNTDAASRTKWLDHLTIYDEEGRKIEEIEYAVYGQVNRTVIEYDENGQVSREIVYNEKNKPTRIRKYEYNENGTKKKQYNYLPNGKLYSVKVFEYIFSD